MLRHKLCEHFFFFFYLQMCAKYVKYSRRLKNLFLIPLNVSENQILKYQV